MKKLNTVLKISPLILLTSAIPLATLISCTSSDEGSIDINIKSKQSPIISFTESRSNSIELVTVQKVFDGITADNFTTIKVSWETPPTSTAIMVLKLGDESMVKSNVIKINLSEIKVKSNINISSEEANNPTITFEFLQKLFDGINKENILFLEYAFAETSLGKVITLTAKDNWTFDGINNKLESLPFKKSAVNVLTREMVIKNYSPTGIWYDLYDLTAEHLQSYTEIGDKAFYGLREMSRNRLRSIEIPNTITRIGKEAFYSINPFFSNNLQTVTFEQGSVLKEIDDWAFYSNVILKTINFPPSLTRIGKSVFANCNKLVSTFAPNSQIKIIDGSNNALEILILPEGLETIGANAFEGSWLILDIVIPKSVKTIGSKPFNLTFLASFRSIKIPKMFESRADKLGFEADAWAKITWY